MTKVTIKREVQAEQWLGELDALPEGAHLCRPEVCWSWDRKLVYFTYAELRTYNWIDADPRELPVPEKLDFMCSGIRGVRKDGSEYWRQMYPFAMWSVKSEAGLKRDHRAVYLDRADHALVETFVDYMYAEDWTNPLPPRAEYRIVNGAYGRGFKPVYLKPGDWLVKEKDAEPRALSHDEFQKIAA